MNANNPIIQAIAGIVAFIMVVSLLLKLAKMCGLDIPTPTLGEIIDAIKGEL